MAKKPKEFVSVDAFAVDQVKQLFICYNTALPFSAEVERMFSTGKDILKPKRAGLSDEHFQMLTFLKGIKIIE